MYCDKLLAHPPGLAYEQRSVSSPNLLFRSQRKPYLCCAYRFKVSITVTYGAENHLYPHAVQGIQAIVNYEPDETAR